MEDAEKQMVAPPLLTAQQMLEKNIVPVKAEFLVRKVAPPKQEAAAAAEGSRDAASAQTGDNGTPAAAAAGGAGRGQEREREQQSKSKSRKQMRKDVRSGRPAELCTNHALGRCTFGERCRFSHDLAAYLQAKQADLPGACPWSAAQGATCPYGITCRYARSHAAGDEHHKLLASIPAPPAEPAPESESDQAPRLAPPASAQEGEAAAAAAPAAAAVSSSGAGSGSETGGLPAGPVALPVPASIEKEVNVMSKEMQAQLWKNRYDFSKADEILNSMGLRISFKHTPKPLPGGGGGRDGGRGDPVATAAADVAATATADAAAAEPMDEAVTEQGQQLEVTAKVKVEDGAGTTDAAADGLQQQEASAAAAPAAMEVEQPSSAPAAEAPISGGDQREGDAAEDAPAAKRQRTDGSGAATAAAAAGAASAASDAAAVAALAAEQAAADAAGAATRSAAAANADVATDAAAAAAAERRAEARAAHVEVAVRPAEKRQLDLRGKSYLAPLTTVGNLPFRRICKSLGVDVTCGEMALATNLLQGQASEWALLKRHPCEDCFGVQVCGGYPDALARVGQLLGEQLSVDFVDLNMGCPIDLVCDKNAGSALLRQPRRIEQIVRATSAALGETPLTFKTRKGYNDGEDVAHTFLPRAGEWGAAAVTLHGRTRQQRYSKLADWEYVKRTAASCASAGLQLVGNGDVFSYTDWNAHMHESGSGLASIMIGRGALIKPWIFTEIKEQRHWDISATERLDLYRSFCAAGLEHWGSDGRGVETTRRFLLEWLSFAHRYVPVGLLEVLPQRMNHRPPAFRGRSELETLLASEEPQDWIRISELLLGRAPASLAFAPKHKSSAYGPPGAASELDMARG